MVHLREGNDRMEEYFRKLRFSKEHHLGLGDIRLTIAQQEELTTLHKKEVEELRTLLTYASRLLHNYLPTEDSLIEYYREELPKRNRKSSK
jgi:hypothetical protein